MGGPERSAAQHRPPCYGPRAGQAVLQRPSRSRAQGPGGATCSRWPASRCASTAAMPPEPGTSSSGSVIPSSPLGSMRAYLPRFRASARLRGEGPRPPTTSSMAIQGQADISRRPPEQPPGWARRESASRFKWTKHRRAYARGQCGPWSLSPAVSGPYRGLVDEPCRQERESVTPMRLMRRCRSPQGPAGAGPEP